MALRVLDPATGERVRSLCEALVPGSAGAWPEVYLDALLARMQGEERAGALADLAAACSAWERGELAGLLGTPAFARVRAFAIEAYYSDFVAPGAPGPGAWARIGFEFPLANMVRKDWSYLGVEGG